MHYRAEIDGLRAVAVIPVILFHAGFTSFSGGFVGVDVFFVISGYLITSILLNELDKGTFSIINFYERRARRILPVLFFVMAVCFPFAWFWLMPTDLQDFIQSIVAVSTFSSNILFWLESDYFDTAAELKPLLHTWSLAVEEQYYIFFPLLLMFMWNQGKRLVIATLLVIFILSLLLAQWAAYNAPTANFYLLPTRGWELLIGVFAAFYFNHTDYRVSAKYNNVLSLVGFAAVIFAVITFDETLPLPSLYTLVPTLGTLLIILFAHPGTLIHRLLSYRLFVGIGLISYSAYLWHQPIIAFIKYRSFTEPSMVLMSLVCVGVLLLAYLSWRFVEKPFRNKQAFDRRFIFSAATSLTAVFISAGLILDYSGSYQSRAQESETMVKLYQPDNRELGANSWEPLRGLSGDEDYGVSQNRYDQQQWFDVKDTRKRLLIVGNSHSKDMFNVLMSSQLTAKRFQIARFGTELADIGEALFLSPNYQLADVVMFVSQYKPSDLAVFEQIIERAIDDDKKPILVKNIYEFEEFGQRTYADFLFHLLMQDQGAENISTKDIAQINEKHYEQFSHRALPIFTREANSLITGLGSQYSQLTVLDRMDYVCDDALKACFAISEEFEKFFYDYGHHTVAGAKFFGRRVDKVKWLADI